MSLKNYSLEILDAINSGKITGRKELNKFKLEISKKYGLKQIPTNPDILSFADGKNRKLIEMLSIKPVRTLSGVAVVAVMAKPHKCPGECIYCPTGLDAETPKSYTGKEPAAMRGLMFGFDPFKQAENRIQQLNLIGHSTDKIELIIMGGTFLSTPQSYQEKFVKECIDAITGEKSPDLGSAKRYAESSQRRIVGITFETRPDFCKEKEINRMLSYGGTRVELGVQNPSDEIYKRINRGHSVNDVVEATQLLKDSAMKIAYHLMPGLPGTEFDKELEQFKEVFSDERFMPDMLKIYPCMVIKGTKLYALWKKGKYKPYSTGEAVKFITEIKKILPYWVRVMRIQRDIPSNVIEAGVDKTNLRQLVGKEMKEKGISCNCIRCREAGIASAKNEISPENPELFVENYSASGGKEFFISLEDEKRKHLFGFCRLRSPNKPFRKEITPSSSLIRELHVYSPVVDLGKKPGENEFQHRGFGKMLMGEAEKIAIEELGCKKMVVISGLGVRDYYRKFFSYRNDGPYVSKNLNANK
ncbi:MAG: tRNA uridine(34) 5-carboxymethylaminomethyl modification radical SAM/GNAT enzyme Elp3 [Candidatus Diapherotrites archaeon]